MNLYGLLLAKYIYADRERVPFLIEEPLPDCKLVMSSATVCRELHQKVYPNRAIDFHECPKAEYRRQVFQYTDSSHSRYAFQSNYDKMRLLKELCRDTVVITFKDIEKKFKTHYHFGNVEGINVLKGKELSVLDLPNLDEVVYGLYAMRAGTSLEKVHMYPQKITYQNKSFFLNTYKEETLWMVPVVSVGAGSETCETAAGGMPSVCLCRISCGTGEIYRPFCMPKRRNKSEKSNTELCRQK